MFTKERESTVEKHLVDQTKAIGGIAPKFKSPQRKNVPDRIVLKDGVRDGMQTLIQHFPVVHTEAELEAIVRKVLASSISFVELKATGKKPTEGQLREHARLRALGFDVHVLDSKEDVDRFLKGEAP